MIDASHARPGSVVRGARPGRRRCGRGVPVHARVRRAAVGPHPASREAYVAYLGTDAAYRKRGLAAALLAHMLQACRAEGFDTVSLDVDTENPTGALGLYERAGFSVLHRQDNYHLVE